MNEEEIANKILFEDHLEEYRQKVKDFLHGREIVEVTQLYVSDEFGTVGAMFCHFTNNNIMKIEIIEYDDYEPNEVLFREYLILTLDYHRIILKVRGLGNLSEYQIEDSLKKFLKSL